MLHVEQDSAEYESNSRANKLVMMTKRTPLWFYQLKVFQTITNDCFCSLGFETSRHILGEACLQRSYVSGDSYSWYSRYSWQDSISDWKKKRTSILTLVDSNDHIQQQEFMRNLTSVGWPRMALCFLRRTLKRRVRLLRPRSNCSRDMVRMNHCQMRPSCWGHWSFWRHSKP